jgi:Tfp pilus assembly protein PilF
MAPEADSGKDFAVALAIELAIREQRNGKQNTAAEIYRRVLAVAPEHPDALHFSGLLAFQQGKKDEGLALVARSLDAAPEHPDFWNNYGNLLKSQGE